MTVEIYRDREVAEEKAAELDAVFNSPHPVIKVKIDQSQAPVYGFRYYATAYKTLEELDVGYIVLDKHWTAEEAAECGLVQVQEEI